MLDLLKIRRKAGRRGAGVDDAATTGSSTPAPAAPSAPSGDPFFEKIKLIPEAKPPASKREKPAPVAAPGVEIDLPERLDDRPTASHDQRDVSPPAGQSAASTFNPEVSYPSPPPAQETDRGIASRRKATAQGSGHGIQSSGSAGTGEEAQLARALIVSAAEAAAAEPEGEQPAVPLYDAERELTNRFLLCRVHGETFAVPIGEILEILRERPLTPVPLTGASLAGVLSLRGRMVPVIDAALRLGFPAVTSDEMTRIVVFEQNEEWIGLRVAGVGQVSTIAPDSLQHPGAALGEANAEMLSGVTRTNDGFVAVPVLARLLEVAR